MTNFTKKFPRTFWVANTIELFERWAWYGFFMLFANYLTASTELGALGLSQSEKGWIMGVGTAILYFLPLITGALADRYGYRRMLFISFIVYATAFAAFPFVNSFVGVFLMYLYLALGAALFKPIISATIAKTTNKDTASIGFGVFYMMVNIGAFVGPLVTLILQKKNYDYVFFASAAIMLINFVMLLFYKEPEREKSNLSLSASIKKVFSNIVLALSDVKLVIFLLLVSGFWTMYNQLFFTLPVFITQWVDTASVYNFFASLGGFGKFFTDNYAVGTVMDAEFITNCDALFIILFQIIISTLVMKRKTLSTMMGGFVVCSIGMALTLVTQNVLFTIAAIFVFAVGEMSSSPKITEYIGSIAPKDKVALYMGCSFLPVFLGNFFAGIISGNVYGAMSDSHTLAMKAVEAKGGAIAEGLSKTDYFDSAATLYNMNTIEFKQYLWNTYDPSRIWIVILAIGLISAVGLYLYDKYLLKSK